jgi:peptidoglycan/xylan/chitin deacetylase (PgdA/CDA1 family)
VRRRSLLLAAPAVVAACAAPAPVPPPTSSAPPPATTSAPAPVGPTEELVTASTGRSEVALTFHGAGDPELAGRVLAALADRGAAATVLAVGTWLQSYPDVARMTVDHGHELGNHTWSHPTLSTLDEAGVRAEIERCRDRLVALTGGPGAFFRPSAAQHATKQVRALAGAAGYPRVLSYDVDSRDFTDPGAAAIRRNAAAARAGSVISLHLGHPGTLTALPGLLDDLAARGLTPVTATRLFS